MSIPGHVENGTAKQGRENYTAIYSSTCIRQVPSQILRVGTRAMTVLLRGKIKMNPLRPSAIKNCIRISRGGFHRTAAEGSFIVSAVPMGPYADVFPPCKIINLDARIEDDKTAPGNDFDEGHAASYEIRTSETPLELRGNFYNTAFVNISSITRACRLQRQEQVLGVLRSLIFLLSFQLLPVAKGSMVPEDSNIILNTMADVLIADPYMKQIDDLYSLQYGGCKEKGRYIHFTPNFLLNDNLTNVDGEKAGVTAIPVFQDCSRDKCKPRSCRHDDIRQNISCSAMYLQYIPYVAEFCDKNTHNSEAPNMQNKIRNHKSTWEVIMESDDFRNSDVNASAAPSETTFRLLQTQDRAVALVLAVSGSMSMHDCIRHLHSAAEVFLLHIIEISSWVGIVTFDSEASEKAPLQQITNDTAHQKLVQCLPIIASGQTNICAGVRKGLKLIADKMNTTYGSKIVLLTDGEDSGTAACLDLLKQSGAKIHTIALRPKLHQCTHHCTGAKELEEFSKLTGGLKLYAVDGAVPSKLAETFSAITSGSYDISEQSIQLESKELAVQHSGWMNTIVPVDRTPFFFLRDPKGKEYGSSDFTINNSNPNTVRLSISGTAEVGDWQFCIKNIHTATQAISVTATSQPAYSDVPPVSIAAHMNRANRAFNPVVFYAEVSQGFLPVLSATVIATIKKDGAAAVTLEPLDNGAGPDTMKNDAIYSRYFTTLQSTGRYSLKVKAHGRNTTTRLSFKQNQALSIPGYRENAGKFQENFYKFSCSEYRRRFCSYLSNCKVTDLHAHIENKTIVLSWTAPGGDFDNGKADHYIIKSSENLLDLRNHFDHATSAGREESLKIKPENFIIENDTIIYFAIRAVDDTNLISEVSNIAQATWFIPPKASVPLDYDSNNDAANSTVIVAIVALCLVVVCIIVSPTLCVLQKGRVDIETMQKH
ncbi:hypothetical protein QYF61_019003, partial [Mycteria americana]